jgi:hypothetical protein
MLLLLAFLFKLAIEFNAGSTILRDDAAKVDVPMAQAANDTVSHGFSSFRPVISGSNGP